MVHFSPNYLLFSTPPTPPFGGGGVYPWGDPSRKVYTFRDVEILLNLDCVHLHVHTIFYKFTFYKIYFIKFIFIYFFKIIFYKNYFVTLGIL